MDPANLVVFGAALFVAVALPGPGIAAIVARVLGRGMSGAAAFTFGMALGDVVWLSFAAGGLVVLAQSFYWVFLAVKWLGIAYLLWLAWKMWNAPVITSAGTLPKTERTGALILAGLSVTMGNPKVMMFYIALLPTIVDLNHLGWQGFVGLTAVTGLVLLVVFSAYIFLAERARGFLVSPQRVRVMNRGSALIMTGAAGWVASN